jgi:hypothetical protein
MTQPIVANQDQPEATDLALQTTTDEHTDTRCCFRFANSKGCRLMGSTPASASASGTPSSSSTATLASKPRLLAK